MLRAALATVGCLLALAASASAAGWTPGPALTPVNGRTPLTVDAGLTAAGPTGAFNASGFQQAAHITGGAWSVPDEGGGFAPVAQFVDPQGGVLVFFSTTTCGMACFTSAGSIYRPPGGPWGSPQGLGSFTGASGFDSFTVAFAPDGTAHAAWRRAAEVQYGVRTPGAGGTWSVDPVLPNSSPGGRGPAAIDIAVAPSGEVTVVWDAIDTAVVPNDYELYASRRSAAGVWSPNPVQLGPASTSPNPQAPSVAVDGTGNATAVWVESGQVGTMSRAAGSDNWVGLAALSTGGSALSITSLVVAPDGRATAAFADRFCGLACLAPVAAIATRQSATGGWTAQQDLGQGNDVDLALGTDGTTVLAWADQANGVHAALGPVGAAMGTPSALASGAVAAPAPDAAVDASGQAFVLWRQDGEYRSALYDTVAPVLSGIEAPAESVAGQPVTLRASASDNWSGASVSWDPGDGSAPVAANEVTHTYVAAGSYTARVSGRDGAGNEVTESRTIVVAQPPAPPPADELPPPVLGESINVFIVKPPVRIKLPGQRTFRPLTRSANLPNGTVIDVRKGRVRVVIANGEGGLDEAEFYGGIFEVNQPKRLRGLANIFLNGGGFKGCPKAPPRPRLTGAAKRRLSPTRSVRKLWGKGSGKFRTVGRFSSATLRGTTWLTDDRCHGTLTRVTEGAVNVRDFVKRKTIVLRAPKRYFARAPKRRGG